MSRNHSQESEVDQLKQSAQQLGADAREVGKHARGAATEAYGSLRDTAAQAIGQVRETAGQYYTQGKEKLVSYEEGVENYVREKPIKSILIAAGVGVVLGMIWKRL